MADQEKILLEIDSNLDEYQKQVEESAKEVARLQDEIKKLSKAGGDNTKEIESNKQKLREARKQYTESTKSVDDLTRANKAQSGSYEQLQAQLRIAEKNLKSQAGLLTKNADGTIQLSQAYVEASKKVENARGAVNKFNLGINQGNTNVGLYSKSIQDAMGKMAVLPGPAGAAAGGIMGMVKAMWALVANPVGAVIAAIVLAVMALVKVFKSFEPVVDRVEQALAALSAAFSVLKEGVIALFTGQKKLGETLNSLKTDMIAAAGAAIVLKKAQQDLEDQQLLSIASQAKYKRQIDELILQSKDRTKTEEERVALIQEALAIEEKAYNERKAMIDEEKRIFEDNLINKKNLTAEEAKNLRELGAEYALKLTQTKGITKDEVQQLAELTAKQEQALNESISLREKALNRQNVLLEKQEEEEKKRQEKRKVAADKAAADEAKRQEKMLADREAFLKAEAKAEEAYDAMVRKLRREYYAEKQKQRDAEKLRIATDMEAQAQIDILRGQSEFETMRIQLDNERNYRIENARKTGADINLIETEYSLKRQQLAEMEQHAKLMIMGSMAGQLADIFGRETAIGKAAAVAQTMINTYVGAQAAFAAGAKFSLALGYANAAVAVAVGLMNVKKILAVNPKVSGGSQSANPSTGGSGAVATRAGGAIAQSQQILPTIGQNIGTTGAQTTANQTETNQGFIQAINNLKVVATIEEIDRVRKNKMTIEENATY